MSVSYVVASIILAVVLTSVVFVLIGRVEHKGRKINLNWLILMMLIATISILTMVLIYHGQHDITSEAIQNAYEQGVEDGKSSATHTFPTNKEMEEWFSSTKEVVVGTNEGGDTAVHIIDRNGEEWVLFAVSIK
jgi:predicted PurR-regulated permease PerM